MIVTIKLYGSISKFGETFALHADTVNEAVRSLLIQLPELKREVVDNFFKVKVAGREVNSQEYIEGIKPDADTCVVEIFPVIAGSGKYGNFIAGAVLTAIGAIAQFGFGQPWGTGLMQIGIGLMVGGVVGMLIKQPTFNQDNKGIEDNRSSFFNNLGNNVGQGRKIPRIYGHLRVGSYELVKSSENVRVPIGGSSTNPKPKVETVTYEIRPVNPVATRDPNGVLYNIDLTCDSVKAAAIQIIPKWS